MYTIVRAMFTGDLEIYVKEHLKQGYIPLGGPFQFSDHKDENYLFGQAMIKHSESQSKDAESKSKDAKFFMIYKANHHWFAYRALETERMHLFNTRAEAEKVAAHFEEYKIYPLEQGE